MPRAVPTCVVTPMLIAYWIIIILFVIRTNQYSRSVSVRFDPVRSGPVQITWYYTLAMHQALWSAACRLPDTIRCLGQRTLYQSNVQLGLPNYSMPVMHTAIPCTGNTADQAVSTVTVQLGAAKHHTRPLTMPMPIFGCKIQKNTGFRL